MPIFIIVGGVQDDVIERIENYCAITEAEIYTLMELEMASEQSEAPCRSADYEF